jgi:Xaa-Pro aminopeptidase
LPILSLAASKEPLPSPTVFSVEPGIYLDGQTGVRIEDLVLYDTSAGRLQRLTSFPSDVLVVGV